MTPNSFPYQISRNMRSLFSPNRRRLSYQSLEIRSLLASDGLLIDLPIETLSTLQVCEAATVSPAAEEGNSSVQQAVSTDAANDQTSDPSINDQVLAVLIDPEAPTNVPFSLDTGFQLLLQLPVWANHRSSTWIGAGSNVAQGDELLSDSVLDTVGQPSSDKAFAIEIDYPSDALSIASSDDSDANAIHVEYVSATDSLLSKVIDFRALRQVQGVIESRAALENSSSDATHLAQSIWVTIKPTSEPTDATAVRQFRMSFVVSNLDDGHSSATNSQSPATNTQQIVTQDVEPDFESIRLQPTAALPAPVTTGSCVGPSSQPGEKVASSDNEVTRVENKSPESSKVLSAPEVKNPALSTLAIGPSEFRTANQTILALSSVAAARTSHSLSFTEQRTDHQSSSSDTVQELATKRSGMRDRPTAIRLSRDPFDLVATGPAVTSIAYSKSSASEHSESQQPINAEARRENAGAIHQAAVAGESIAVTSKVEPSADKSIEPDDVRQFKDLNPLKVRDQDSTAAEESESRIDASEPELIRAKSLFNNPASYGAFVLVAAIIVGPLEYEETREKRLPSRDI